MDDVQRRRRRRFDRRGSQDVVVCVAVSDAAPVRLNGRWQRRLAVAAVSGLLVAAAAAFAITERSKLTPSPIAGTRVAKTFSPVCRCITDSASIRFRLRLPTRPIVISFDNGYRSQYTHALPVLRRL